MSPLAPQLPQGNWTSLQEELARSRRSTCVGRVSSAERRERRETKRLEGRQVALLFEKTSTRTRCAFEVAVAQQGGTTTYLDPSGAQIGHKESAADTARVLGRWYDAIEYRGFRQDVVETLAANAGVPVYNGLTDE